MKNFVQKGERITFAKTALTGPNSPIKSGDPVYVGRLAGVAVADAVPGSAGPADDSNVVVQVVGVFTISVQSKHHAISVGSTVYIDTNGVVSDDYTAVPFGVVLDAVTQYATTSVRVKLFGITPGAIGADS